MKEKTKTSFKTNLIIFALIAVVVGVTISGLYIFNHNNGVEKASIVGFSLPEDEKIYETDFLTFSYPVNWDLVITDTDFPYGFMVGENMYVCSITDFAYMGDMESFYNRNRKSLEEAEGANYIFEEKRDFKYYGYDAFEIPNRTSDAYEENLRYIKVGDTIYQILYVTKYEGFSTTNVLSTINDIVETIEFK